MKRNLLIPYSYLIPDSLSEMSAFLDNLDKHHIGYQPWADGADVVAGFSITYNNEAVMLKFYVTEEHISARYNQPNDTVHKDSCVEFFIAFPGEAKYYNFEFNCKGNCLVGYGSGRQNRELIQPSLIQDIRTFASFKTEYAGTKAMISWELTIAIPFASFWHHDIYTLKGHNARMNFYKCGDELPQPHYLCWNKIEATEPNFHLPEFFGEATFEN